MPVGLRPPPSTPPAHPCIFMCVPSRIAEAPEPESKRSYRMLPGGYDFIHLIFWPVVALVAVGTNLIPIALSLAVGILLMESLGKA